MKFIIKGNTGFKVTEEKAEYKSKKGRAKVACPVEADYVDQALKAMPAQGAKDYMTKFGINLQSEYKSAFAKFGKDVMARLEKLESRLDKAEADFVKKAKKKRPTDAELKSFVAVLNKALSDGCQVIADKASQDYKKMMDSMVEGVRTKTLKAMGAAGKPGLKQKAKLVFKVIIFAAVVVSIVTASIALPGLAPVAIGVGVAALVVKGLTGSITFIKELKAFSKSYEKSFVTAAKDLTTAEAAVDKALAQVRLAKDSYTALEVKLGESVVELGRLEAKAASEKGPELANAQKKMAEAKADLTSYKKTLGDPNIALAELEKARTAMRKAAGIVADGSKSKSAVVGKAGDKLQVALGLAGKAVALVP